MLFVSRRIGDKYAIVDTDDGSENVVDLSYIVDAVEVYGLRIEGILLPEVNRKIKPSNLWAKVYQPPETLTTLQLKTKVLLHVEVLTYKNIITSVGWNGADLVKPVSIRLSQFGTSCADYILASADTVFLGRVTLILDDKIEFSHDTFWRNNNTTSLGVVYDIRECSDEKAWVVYRALCRIFESVLSVRERVVDNKARFRAMWERGQTDRRSYYGNFG